MHLTALTKVRDFSGNKHFSLCQVIVRPTKIMNRDDKNWASTSKIKIFKTIFLSKSWSSSPIYITIIFLERFDKFSTLKNDFENQNFEMFEEVDHNFDK